MSFDEWLRLTGYKAVTFRLVPEIRLTHHLPNDDLIEPEVALFPSDRVGLYDFSQCAGKTVTLCVPPGTEELAITCREKILAAAPDYFMIVGNKGKPLEGYLGGARVFARNGDNSMVIYPPKQQPFSIRC